MRGKIMIELTKNSRLLAAPVEQIFFNHNHPRRIVTKSDIDTMVMSLTIAGQIQPIGIRRIGTGCILIFGQLRLLAARQLGWQTINAIEFPEIANSELFDLVLNVHENLHRTSLELDEIAVAVNTIFQTGMSELHIAQALGKTAVWVAGMLSIACDPVARRIIEAGRLADVDAWLIFKNLVPEYRKMLLDGSEMITLQACAQIQTKPLKSKKLVKTENGGAIMDEKPSKTCLNTGGIDLHEAGGG
jgi:ParB family chromosome partitioning protein